MFDNENFGLLFQPSSTSLSSPGSASFPSKCRGSGCCKAVDLSKRCAGQPATPDCGAN